MPREQREFYKGGFWHIFNRGVAKEDIFREDDDFRFYLYRVKESLKKFPVIIHAYNLVPNHVHYLIEQIADILPGEFIGSMHGSFSSFINKKYSRAGHLFQDRYKANPIKDDFLAISFYINLNKALEGLKNRDKSVVSKTDLDKLLKEAENDPWSSYSVYLGLRDDGITQPKFILSLLSDDIKKARQEYQKLARKFLISGYFLKTRNLIFEEEKMSEEDK